MSKEKKYNYYLIRIKMEELVERINAGLKNEVRLKEEELETIKEEYIKMMKSVYKTVHIYGVDELGFDSFYIKPTFALGIAENQLKPINYKYVSSIDDIKIDWEDIFMYSNTVSIIGGAGFGKTSFLKNMIHDYKYLKTAQAKNLIPIYCDLKKFAENSNQNMGYTIEDFLVDSMRHDTSLDRINKEFLKYYLVRGQCLILFDALDEVETPDRVRVHKLIVSFFETINKNNKICITSRLRGFVPKTKIIYKVVPVDKEQVIKYVNKMIEIKQFQSHYKDDFIKECELLIKDNFLESFLMLSLLINLYKAERRVPKNKIELYKKSVEYISKEREKGISEGCPRKSKINFDLIASIINTDESFCQLAYLAKPNNKDVHEDDIIREFSTLYDVAYKNQNETLQAIKEFLKFCAERTELFVKSEDTKYKFYHKSFFEYFYSKYLVNKKTFKQIYKEITKFDHSQDIPMLTLELLKESKYTDYKKLIEHLIKEITSDKLDFDDSLNVLIHVDEPSYLRNIYEVIFKYNQPLIKSRENKNDHKVMIRDIWILIKQQILIDNLFRDITLLDDKDIQGDILKYYSKEDYLKAMYIYYLLRQKPISLSFINDQYMGLVALYQHVGNIFTKEDFQYQEIEEILHSIDFTYLSKSVKAKKNSMSEDYFADLKQKKKLILDFYNSEYKNTLLKIELRDNILTNNVNY